MLSKVAPEVLKGCRRTYAKIQHRNEDQSLIDHDFDGLQVNDHIHELLLREEPCMVCRFGAVELSAVGIHQFQQTRGGFLTKSLKYIRGEIGPFLWDRSIRHRMHNNAGFFPPTNANLARFGELMLDDMKQIDVLGSWLPDERVFESRFPQAKVAPLTSLEPYRFPNPWSAALRGKRVLVIHPFEQSIRRQFEKRHLLFKNPDVLPDCDLDVIKAVQTIAKSSHCFPDWFAALDSMCQQMREREFDVAIIGAGAYGLPLAAFAKKIGKKAVHLGGATQLLFGIKGKRWDKSGLYNEHWERPLPAEVPQNSTRVEGGCYW